MIQIRVAASSLACVAAVMVAGSITLGQPPSPRQAEPFKLPELVQPGQSPRVPAECAAKDTQTAKVVCAAEAFLKTLSDEQKKEVLLPLTRENAAKWSNFPYFAVPRIGIMLKSLSEEQQSALDGLLQVVLGTSAGDGYTEIMQIRMADDAYEVLRKSPTNAKGGGEGKGGKGEGKGEGKGGKGGGKGGVTFSNKNYFVAFLGTPSTTGTWILQFGGHHIAVIQTFKGGKVAGVTPMFTGIEPRSWTDGKTTFAPMKEEYDAVVAMLGGLTDAQRQTAKLSKTFRDVSVGPGQDGRFPTEKEGVAVSKLDEKQKALVFEAIKHWVQDVDNTTAQAYLAIYEKELNDTYVAFSGDPRLLHVGDYIRIDGPSVWIELCCQPSSIEPCHIHSVWRDRHRDYGGEFDFSKK